MVNRIRQDPPKFTRSSGVPLWLESRAHLRRRPALEEDLDADVVIVGAGFTGLWAAYYLIRDRPDLRVVLLESEYAGFGASGRNGGWCSAIFPVSLGRVEKLYDHSAAIKLQTAMNETVLEVGEVVNAEGIQCNFDRNGFVSLARTSAQLERARATVSVSKSFGLNDQWQFLDATSATDLVNASEVLGATFTEHCALLDPDKLVRGLASWIEEQGGRIFENTRVAEIDRGRVRTENGVGVSAPIVIRATEAFTPSFSQFKRDIVPLYSLVVATEPLSPEAHDEIFGRKRVAFNDMRNLRIYAQPTADGRVVFGGRGAPYHYRSKVSPNFDVDEKIHRKIAETLVDFFPSLGDVTVTHRWGGALGVPRDWFPSVGFDARSGFAWAGPYVGDGVATSNLAGRILRNLITGKHDELNDLPVVNHHSPKWEVEPMRWLGVNMGLRAASLADFEERVTRRPSKISKGLERLTGAH